MPPNSPHPDREATHNERRLLSALPSFFSLNPYHTMVLVLARYPWGAELYINLC